MLNAFEIDKQRIHIILCDNLKNMKKAKDDMEVPSVCCVSHTLQLAVHEGLLSQCTSHTHLLKQGMWSANAVIACRIKKISYLFNITHIQLL